MSNEKTEKKTLDINCGFALLLRDREGMLDTYERIRINCGSLISSNEISAKLAEKGASLNTGNWTVLDIKGEIVQLEGDTVIDGRTSYKDVFVIAMDNLIIRGNGAECLREAEGVFVIKTLYYPESSDIACFARVKGKTCAYPDNAHPVLGDSDPETLLAETPEGIKHIWVSGKVTALDETALARAREQNLTITCQSLYTYESFNSTYGSLFTAAKKTLIPDGYEITGSLQLNSGEIALHGPKLYVNGDLTLEEKDVPCLEEAESIIVTGKANLPASAAKAFRKIGKAADYNIIDGHTRTINGFETFSHEQLQVMVERGEQISVKVNGCLLFSDDVTTGDMDAIDSLSYEGLVLIPGNAKGALASRVKRGNGLMVDPAFVEKVLGKSIQDLIKQYTGGGADGESNPQKMSINTGKFILI
jgi:hypothetical protein